MNSKSKDMSPLEALATTSEASVKFLQLKVVNHFTKCRTGVKAIHNESILEKKNHNELRRIYRI